MLDAGFHDQALARSQGGVPGAHVEDDRALETAQDLLVRMRVRGVAIAGPVPPLRHRIPGRPHLVRKAAHIHLEAAQGSSLWQTTSSMMPSSSSQNVA